MAHNKLQLPFLLLLLAGILLISFFILRPFFAPLALAIVFSVVFYPVYKNLLSYFREKEGLAALMTLTLSAVCILIPFIILGSQIVNEAIDLYNSTITGTRNQNLLITLIMSIGDTVGNIIPATGPFFTNLAGNVDVYVNQGLSWLIKHIGTALSSVSSLLLSFFIFFISFYYLLRDGKKLKHAIISLSPLDDKDDTIIFDRLESAVNSVIKGSLFIALIQGILTAIGFTLFGIPNSILWGTVTVIAALIPGLGTALIILPAVAYLFITGNPLQASGLLAWGIVAVGLIDNILGPKLVGKNLEIHPLFILLSVLGGVAYFGPLGIFLGPLTISLLFAFITVYSDIIQRKNS